MKDFITINNLIAVNDSGQYTAGAVFNVDETTQELSINDSDIDLSVGMDNDGFMDEAMDPTDGLNGDYAIQHPSVFLITQQMILLIMLLTQS